MSLNESALRKGGGVSVEAACGGILQGGARTCAGRSDEARGRICKQMLRISSVTPLPAVVSPLPARVATVARAHGRAGGCLGAY